MPNPEKLVESERLRLENLMLKRAVIQGKLNVLIYQWLATSPQAQELHKEERGVLESLKTQERHVYEAHGIDPALYEIDVDRGEFREKKGGNHAIEQAVGGASEAA